MDLNQTLKIFTAPRASRFSIGHYDHAVTRYLEDSSHDDDPNVNPHLTEKLFIKSKQTFDQDSTSTKKSIT